METHSDALPGAYLEVGEQVTRLLGEFTDLWWQSEAVAPEWGRHYTVREQLAREEHLAAFLRSLFAELERPPSAPAERQATQACILAAVGALLGHALDLPPELVGVVLAPDFTRSMTQFAQRARRFDPTVSGNEIFQASRNVATMNGLQRLLGRPVQLTPAVFAYSMLYPYTDNYLDDPTISPATKRAFNIRLARRLEGEDLAPANDHERKICDLVSMVEWQYERSRFPQVFASLLAIHEAQCKSLGLLRRGAAPYERDVLGLSLGKGGASVLADGYLVAGELSEAQAAFMFGYGAFLQLLDDLQDAQQDARDGLLTVFSLPARRWPLDRLVTRTLAHGQRVFEGLSCFDDPAAQPLKELMGRSLTSLLINAVGRAGDLCTRRYRWQAEDHSPFRFAFLRRCARKMARRRVSLMRMIEAFAVAEKVDSM
jgi:hypothetical protein